MNSVRFLHLSTPARRQPRLPSSPQARVPAQRILQQPILSGNGENGNGKRRDFAPKLMELNDEVLFGDIWERPGLSKRDRSLITVATLVALYWINELPFHIVRARENGISKQAWRRLACAFSSVVGKCRVGRHYTMILTRLVLSASARLRMSRVVGEKRIWQSECN
jgi:alkylhydroperoxidase/carboxymuconolactone decarboxylase family protein YurZ